MKIYVGNLAFNITEDELLAEFGAFGKVESASIVNDKFSGRSRGFAFVEMPVKEEAEEAIAGLNGKSLNDRVIVVNEARPPVDRGSGNRRNSYRDHNRGNRQRRY